jgi:hypothetical protein
MDGNTVTINSLPKCYQQNYCSCFDNLFKKRNNYNQNDVLQFTSFYLEEITNYIYLIESHSQLDIATNSNEHSNVNAAEVHKANNHFHETVKKLQLQLLQNKEKGDFHCKYYNESMNVNQLIDFYDELCTLNSKSIQLFNKPQSPLPTKHLVDLLELHRNCLYILQQLYNVAQYGRAIFKKDNYHINIHQFQFKRVI